MNSSFKWLAAWAMTVALLTGFALVQRTQAEDAKKSASSSKSDAAKPVVAVFRFTGAVTEMPEDESFPFGGDKQVSLKEVLQKLKKAEEDKNVKAVIITLDNFSPGRAQIEEIRQALASLRAAGKDIYAHADSLQLPQYILLSGATQISVVPTGDLWLTGLHGESPYVRGLLKTIGVTPDFLTCGAYKSAAEMFMREGPSPQAEEMMNWLLDSLYDSSVKQIARGRGVEPDKVRKWIDEGPYTAEGARTAGLIDNVQHREEFEAGVKQRFDGNVKFDYKYGEKDQQKMDLSSPMGVLSFYAELLGGGKKPKSHKDAIAIVYVEGPIVDGTAESSPLEPGAPAAASTPIRRALDKVAADDTIKAVVLRVNSPGGSATASEIILNAANGVKAKKPFVVSMGDIAGSGGYYVACGSDTIFADDCTLTGSIGVVGGKIATGDMWSKVGIAWKEYSRGANAALLSTAHPFTPEQRKKVQAWMDELYGVFKGHVTAIRADRLKKPIDELAGGRVYTGRQALDLGLVDKIGTLDDAIKFAAQQAKIEKYELRTVPEPKSFIEKLMGDQSGDDEGSASMSLRLPAARQTSLLSMAMPYLHDMDPQHVDAVVRVFQQLAILQHDGVVLMTPEYLLPDGR